MPVIVELNSLVAGVEPLRRATGEADLGARALGATAAASDGEVAALAFDTPQAIRRAVGLLAGGGLTLDRVDGEPGDLAAVQQQRGPLGWWPWLELAQVAGPGGQPVLAARLEGGEARALAVPGGWRFEGSATQAYGLDPLRLVDRPLRHLGREATCDLYRDRWTGEEVRFPRRRPPVRVVVEGPGAGRAEVLAERVVAGLEVELGLMFREALPPGTGMLFDFPAAWHHGFWMKNTLVSLDLLWVDPGGRVLNVAEGTRPLSAAHHHPAGPVRRVLEVPAGWCRAHGVGAGARLGVVGEAAPP